MVEMCVGIKGIEGTLMHEATTFIHKLCGLVQGQWWRVSSRPPRRRMMAVLRSPHIYKKSQEHFELRRRRYTVSFVCVHPWHALLCMYVLRTSHFPGIELEIQCRYADFLF